MNKTRENPNTTPNATPNAISNSVESPSPFATDENRGGNLSTLSGPAAENNETVGATENDRAISTDILDDSANVSAGENANFGSNAASSDGGADFPPGETSDVRPEPKPGGRQRKNGRPGVTVPPSVRLFSGLAMAAATVSVVMLAVAGVAALFEAKYGQYAFGIMFYALIITITLTLVLGIRQALRGVKSRAIVPIVLGGLCACAVIAAIIIECVASGTFFLAPFNLG